jgi:hypothetical protein
MIGTRVHGCSSNDEEKRLTVNNRFQWSAVLKWKVGGGSYSGQASSGDMKFEYDLSDPSGTSLMMVHDDETMVRWGLEKYD